jgi:hypothetical protein
MAKTEYVIKGEKVSKKINEFDDVVEGAEKTQMDRPWKS